MAVENPKPLREIGRLRAVSEIGDRQIGIRYSLSRAKHSEARRSHSDELDVYIAGSLCFRYAKELHL